MQCLAIWRCCCHALFFSSRPSCEDCSYTKIFLSSRFWEESSLFLASACKSCYPNSHLTPPESTLRALSDPSSAAPPPCSPELRFSGFQLDVPLASSLSPVFGFYHFSAGPFVEPLASSELSLPLSPFS